MEEQRGDPFAKEVLEFVKKIVPCSGPFSECFATLAGTALWAGPRARRSKCRSEIFALFFPILLSPSVLAVYRADLTSSVQEFPECRSSAITTVLSPHSPFLPFSSDCQNASLHCFPIAFSFFYFPPRCRIRVSAFRYLPLLVALSAAQNQCQTDPLVSVMTYTGSACDPQDTSIKCARSPAQLNNISNGEVRCHACVHVPCF